MITEISTSMRNEYSLKNITFFKVYKGGNSPTKK